MFKTLIIGTNKPSVTINIKAIIKYMRQTKFLLYIISYNKILKHIIHNSIKYILIPTL